MIFLFIPSLLWALSFGLIETQLESMDPTVVAFSRLLLAALLFLPWLRMPANKRAAFAWMGLGLLQYGLMYVFYVRSYQTLAAHQVAMLTVLTPVHVVLIDAAWRRTLNSRHLLAALLAVAGAFVLVAEPGGWTSLAWRGALLVQAANLCFALGQVLYRRYSPGSQTPPLKIICWMYLGAVVGSGMITALAAPWPDLTSLTLRQTGTLLYLGIVPTGVCFYLWNLGVARTGVSDLAVMNNAKIPFAVVFAVTLFGEEANFANLGVSCMFFILALWSGKSDDRRTHADLLHKS